ncbi:MAG: flagellar basal-body MS-ring/collar protein FliF [Myxococcota bacterium]
MESLLKQLRELPARLAAMPAGLRVALIGGVVLAALIAAGVAAVARGGEYQYAFTNLSQEDSTEASGILRNAGVPFRVEANGSALAVPADKVYDARILLATAGLPRGAGVGFELFDRGDLGVSEFTQRVNLRRAIEGELARTIGNFQGVRNARVTVSLAEKGLFRDEDKKASASVVVNLQPGRTLGERELAGIRHLVSSATPGLPADAVTVMDGTGAVLSSDSAWNSAEVSYQRQYERDLEHKVVSMLERTYGQGKVIARVTAAFDFTQVVENRTDLKPDDGMVVTKETTRTTNSNNQTTSPAGIAGAVPNQPLVAAPPQQGPTQQGTSSSSDTTRETEVTNTRTQTVAKLPRLAKLSVAVMVDGLDGKPRTSVELGPTAALVRSAVGIDDARGDQFELTSQVFEKIPEGEAPAVAATTPVWVYAAVGGGLLLAAIVAFVLLRRGAKGQEVPQELVLQPGATVAALEAKANAIDGVATEEKKEEQPVLIDPLADLKEKARAMVKADPERAVMLVRAWLHSDLEEVKHHG